MPRGEIRPALEASRDELAQRFNQQAAAVRSLNARIELHPITGSAYSGVIEDYREVGGFLLAQRPASIRMIGQAPVVAKNIFDMVSDAETFRIFLPTKNKFLVGSARAERRSDKPIENLRPQHLLDALFWEQLAAGRALIEEADAPPHRYYVLTELRNGATLEMARKVWFDRADLAVARVQLYGPGGRRVADVDYADWRPAGEARFPHDIRLHRPQEDYRLELRITRLTLNEVISAERFQLEQPAGTELVRVGDSAPGERP